MNNGKHNTHERFIDYDIHGLAGIRLINPSSKDIQTITRQIGPLQKDLARQPDIIIRFVDYLPIHHITHVTYGVNGFDDDGFYILKSSKKPAKVKIPFETIGSPQCEIVCETGLKAVPLLLAILNLTMLKKDCVSIHASGFLYRNIGVLIAGWAKGGKTETLLSFAQNGASYVGDEWILLQGNGEKMYGIPEIIRLWQWHMEYLPHVKKQLKADKLALFKTINWLDTIQQNLPDNFLPAKWLREAMPALRRQLNARFDPEKVFVNGFGPFMARPDKIVFALSHNRSTTTVEHIAPFEIAKHMISSIQYKLMPFWEQYWTFKYAFPDLTNHFLENVRDLQFDILCRGLAKKDAYVIKHPYPVSFDELYNKLKPICEQPVPEVHTERIY